MSLMKADLFAYVLGMMLGDGSKLGGELEGFASMNIDLQLTQKHPSNERMGEFVCMCVNCLGFGMDRIADKAPTGTTRFGRQPAAAFRWASARSPLFAWMFSAGLGLGWNQSTTVDAVHMDWIFRTPSSFRLRFVQAIADSDGTVKPSEVIITNVPNADFVTQLLKSLGMSTAHTVYENHLALRTMVNRRQAATLPIFSEFVRGYRYEKLRKNI